MLLLKYSNIKLAFWRRVIARHREALEDRIICFPLRHVLREMNMSQYFVDTNGQISANSASESNDASSIINASLSHIVHSDLVTIKKYRGFSKIRSIFIFNKSKQIASQKLIAEERLKKLCKN